MERLIPESKLDALVEAKVKAILAEMLGLTAIAPTASLQKWSTPEETAKALSVTTAHLARMRRNGYFSEGTHYRVANCDPSASANGVRFEYNIERCQERKTQPRSKWLKASRAF